MHLCNLAQCGNIKSLMFNCKQQKREQFGIIGNNIIHFTVLERREVWEKFLNDLPVFM